MKLEKVNILQPFDLIFYKGNGLLSRIIKHQTSSHFSHVGMFLFDFHVAEINWYYPLKIRHLKYRRQNYDVFRVKGLTDEQKKLIVKYIQEHINDRYDFWSILRFLLYKYFKIKYKDDKDRFICSEWIYDAFKNAGIELFQGINEDGVVVPDELIE